MQEFDFYLNDGVFHHGDLDAREEDVAPQAEDATCDAAAVA